MFDANFFADPKLLISGALTGLVFGLLLQKGKVAYSETILGFFLFKDFTVMKVMLTAIVVGGFGIWAMHDFAEVGLHLKSTYVVANVLGGAIFGVGMAICGYCPGTGVAALGTGAKDAIFAVLGMLVGAMAYAEAQPWLKEKVFEIGKMGKVEIASETGLSPFIYLAGLAVVAIVFFLWIEGVERKKRHNAA
jgi:uncharacterized membrane protein YedE/YeeE